MDSQKSKMLVALLLLPLALLFVGPSAAQDAGSDASRTIKVKTDKSNTPDLVITEDSQISPSTTKLGKAVVGSCETGKPLWEGKIAIKNIGGRTVRVRKKEEEQEERPAALPAVGAEAEVQRREREERKKEKGPPHVRVYVPNNIEIQGDAWLTHDLAEFGQELLDVKIGEKIPKCRSYDAPPVFDERLSGRPGPIHSEEGPGPGPGPGPEDRYTWRIKRIQRALIDKGYSLSDDGDYGPQTIKALVAYFKERHQAPPREIYQKPLPPETVNFLLETLGVGPPDEAPSHASGGDECIRGVNLVPLYIEIDPEGAIADENRSNNRVQFTVAIDCSNIAR